MRTAAKADPKFHHAAETTVSVGMQWRQQEMGDVQSKIIEEDAGTRYHLRGADV